MKKIVLGMVLGMFAVAATGCGAPSKEETCGDCGPAKEACELVYDACDGDNDCIDALECS